MYRILPSFFYFTSTASSTTNTSTSKDEEVVASSSSSALSEIEIDSGVSPQIEAQVMKELETSEKEEEEPDWDLSRTGVKQRDYVPLDSTVSSFLEGGESPSFAQALYTGTLAMTARELGEGLRATYGEDLKERIFGRYQLGGKEELCLGDVTNALTGIAANVKESDLRLLFRSLKGEESRMKPLECRFFLSEADRSRISAKGSFEELTVEELSILERAFRTIPDRESKSFLPVLDLFPPNITKSYLWHSALKEDVKFLKHISVQGEFDRENLPVAISEYEGKRLIYAEPGTGQVYPSYTREGKPAYFANIFGWRQDATGDAVFYALSRELNSVGEDRDLRLNFRGTQWNVASKASWKSLQRDFERGGIGADSFDGKKEQILQHLRDAIALYPEGKKVHLSVSGHSLGGVDSQYALKLLVGEMASSDDPIWKRIETISVIAHNPPGVSVACNEQFKKQFGALIEKRPELKGKISFSLVSYRGDFVELAGAIYLGAGVEDLVETVYLLEAKVGERVDLHKAWYFTDSDTREKFALRKVTEGLEFDRYFPKGEPPVGWLGYFLKPISNLTYTVFYETARGTVDWSLWLTTIAGRKIKEQLIAPHGPADRTGLVQSIYN